MKKHGMKSLALFTASLLLSGCATIYLGPDPSAPLQEEVLQSQENAKGKVLLIAIDGTLSNQADSGLLNHSPALLDAMMMQLKKAAKDPEIKALLLRINSPGGGVTTSDLLYHELMAFKRQTGKAIFVQMQDVAASGGYYISLAADHIQASPTTLTGSVGVISIMPNVVTMSEKIGLEVKTFTSGANKDIGSPFRKALPGDDAYLQALIDGMAERFYKLVSHHRQLTSRQLAEIKSAKVFLGEQAVTVGLVDSIGYLSDAPQQACRLGGAKSCQLISYRFNANKNANAYSPTLNSQGITPEVSLIQSNLFSNLLNLKPGHYYLYLP